MIMSKILAITGSLRKASLNTLLMLESKHIAAEHGIKIDIADLHGIPLYNGDVEEQGMPDAVTALKERILAADALLLVSPEYNGTIPGVLKNALDWLSRPAGEAARIFAGRPIAVIGASPSAFGTISGQTHWLPVFKSLGCTYFSGSSVMISRAHQAFDEHGRLSDEA